MYSGIWLDLDERKRPVAAPKLTGWATPDGWQKGLRPECVENQFSNTDQSIQGARQAPVNGKATSSQGEREELICQIEAMAEPLGKGLYRGLLKAVVGYGVQRTFARLQC